MRFRGCFRQCNGKIPLKLNGRPHFCRRSIVLAFCGSPCRVCAGRKPGRSPIAPPGRSWRPLAAVSRPPGGWGCAPPSPQTCQKGPATCLGRPLQTAGFSPQGRRRAAAPALRARFRHKLIPPASPAASAATAGPPAPLPAPPRSGKAPPPDWSAFLGGHPAQRAQQRPNIRRARAQSVIGGNRQHHRAVIAQMGLHRHRYRCIGDATRQLA